MNNRQKFDELKIKILRERDVINCHTEKLGDYNDAVVDVIADLIKDEKILEGTVWKLDYAGNRIYTSEIPALSEFFRVNPYHIDLMDGEVIRMDSGETIVCMNPVTATRINKFVEKYGILIDSESIDEDMMEIRNKIAELQDMMLIVKGIRATTQNGC